MRLPRNIVLRFDMRSSPQGMETASQRYRTAIEMAQWADRNSIDVIGLSEHHDTVDGFLASPLQLAGMMVAVTRQVRINVSALLVPLHDPLRLAEDIAVLDIVSGGRFSATCGLGYRESEYQCFGVDWTKRGEIFDQKLEILVSALKGDVFDYQGRSTRLTPAPDSQVYTLLTVGGNSKAAARRAARFGLFFCPALDDATLEATYLSACQTVGFRHGFVISPRSPATTFISQNPDKCWKQIGEYLLYDALAYRGWQHHSRRAYAESFATTIEELKHEGKYRVLTPEQAIQTIRETGSLHLAPLTGGVPVDLGWNSLRLFEDQIRPFL